MIAPRGSQVVWTVTRTIVGVSGQSKPNAGTLPLMAARRLVARPFLSGQQTGGCSEKLTCLRGKNCFTGVCSSSQTTCPGSGCLMGLKVGALCSF